MTPKKTTEIRKLADVYRALKQAEKISPPRRKEMLSSVSSLGRMCGQPLHDIPVDPQELREVIKELHPVQTKVSKKRLSNIKAGLILALRFAGAAEELRLAHEESEEWAAFRNSGTELHQRYALARFARYCTAHNLEPSEVTDAVMDAYEAHLARATINCDPKKARVETAKTFNCVLKRSGSKQPLLTASKGTNYITPPLSVYPKSFQKEFTAYLGRLGNPDLFAEDDLVKPLRPHTLRNTENHIRQFLDAAVLDGYERSHFTGLATLLDKEVVERAFKVIMARIGRSVPPTLLNILGTLIAIARHEVKAPEEVINRLLKIQKRIRQKVGGRVTRMSEKSRRRMEQFDDPENIKRLVVLPHEIAQRARRQEPSGRSALAMMYATAMTLLLVQPMRAANLASIELGKHLTPVRQKNKIIYRLHISADEVKNGVEILVDYTGDEADILRIYLRAFRPLLADDPENFLFPQRSGGARSASHLSEGIAAVVKKHTGLEVSAHLFRHFAARIYLAARPGDYESTRRLLGQKKLETTTSFYAPFSNRAAHEEYCNMLSGIRK